MREKMRKIIALVLLLASQGTQANPLVTNDYKALAEGSVELVTADGTRQTLDSGEVQVEISRVNFFTSPIEFTKGARKLTVIKNDTEFEFTIPSQFRTQEGRVIIHRDQAQQSAHLSFVEDSQFVGSQEVEDSRSCTYSGYCYTCSLGIDGNSECNYKLSSSCSGSQRALYRIDNYLRSLKIMIYTDTNASRIQTDKVPESDRSLIKTLDSCG